MIRAELITRILEGVHDRTFEDHWIEIGDETKIWIKNDLLQVLKAQIPEADEIELERELDAWDGKSWFSGVNCHEEEPQAAISFPPTFN